MNRASRNDPASDLEIARLKERLSGMERLVPRRPSLDHLVGNAAGGDRVGRQRLSSPLGSLASMGLAGVIVVTALLLSQRGPNVPQAGSSPSAAVDTSAWITLAPQGESFSVLMPCAPDPVSGSSPNVAGGTDTYTYWTCTDSSGRTFLVSLSKYAKGGLSGPLSGVLDDAESKYLRGFPNAQVESQSDMTLDGHIGRTAVFANATARVRGEVVIVGDSIYVVGVSYPIRLGDDGVANAFMASFQLTV